VTAIPASPSLGSSGVTEVVSLSTDGVLGNDSSGDAVVARGGRIIAFQSNASNLVPDDNNLANDVFVRDRVAGTIERVSVSSAGEQGNGISFGTAISDNGRFVAFTSHASNLVDGDANGTSDVFVHDRTTGKTELVSVTPDGTSGDGACAFGIDISGDGRFVVFASKAGNLTSDPPTGQMEIYVRDRLLMSTELVSLASDGAAANRGSTGSPSISADGQYVVFETKATNLSTDDRRGTSDIFVRDRSSATTTLVSARRDGTAANGSSRRADISDDGRHVAFDSGASDLVRHDTNNESDVFITHLKSGHTRRVSQRPGGQQVFGYSIGANISAHGRYVAFSSMGAFTDPALDTRIRAYLWDRKDRSIELVSVTSDGTPATVSATADDVTPHGRFVVLSGNGTDLVSNAPNPRSQIFLRIRSAY
jgi:hypothetical protein